MRDVNYFFKPKDYLIDQQKLGEYHDLLVKKLGDKYKSKLNEFLDDFKFKIDADPLKFLNGKYLFDSIYNYLRYKCNLKPLTKDKRIFRNLIYGMVCDNKGRDLFSYIGNN